MPSATFAGALRAGKPVVGMMVRCFTGPAIVPIVARAGLDFIVIDQEHGPATVRDIEHVVLAARGIPGKGLAVIVRVPVNDYQPVAKALDAGADGIMVPRVEDAAGADAACKHATYPPAGHRGFGMPSHLVREPGASQAATIQETNENVVVLVQVESVGGVDAIEAILGVDRVDGVIVGPADLSLSLGVPGMFGDPAVRSAAGRVLAACKAAGKPFGIHFSSLDDSVSWKERGASILLHGTDASLLADRARHVVATLGGLD